MKKNLIIKSKIILLFLLISSISFAQVRINTINPKTTLDVEFDPNSTSTIPPGIRAPNLKLSELNTYTNLYGTPQIGAFVYITQVDTIDGNHPQFDFIKTSGYYFFDGLIWNVFAQPQTEVTLTEPWFSTETNLGATSDTENIYHSAQVGIGKVGLIDPNAQLEITSTSKGLIILRLSTAERNAITSPTTSMMIWNTDELCFNFYKGDKGWKSLCENETEATFEILGCENSYVGGTYIVGTPTNYSNYIQINVQVSKPGTYNIEATTTVGLYFQRSGKFTQNGNYTITIPSYGSPTQAGSTQANISFNDKPSTCSVSIPLIAPASVTYTIDNTTDIVADPLTKGVSTSGKKVTINVNATVEGYTNITATNVQYGIVYSANNKRIEVGTNTIVLYSNGNAIASDYSGTTIPFQIDGLGLNTSNSVTSFNIDLESSTATASCDSYTLNGNYIYGTPLNSSNTLTVRVNVTTPGTYNFIASNAEANIQFKYSGGFTSTGLQTITAEASTITNGDIGPIKSYSFNSTLNGESLCNNIPLNIIYPTKKVLLIGTASTQTQSLLKNTVNFGPKGTFKIESIETLLDGNANLTATTLLNYINIQNYQMIILPQGMNGYPIPSDAQQVLANFITKKKGVLLYLSSGGMLSNVKGTIDKLYPNNTIQYNTTNYLINSTILPNTDTNADDSKNKYLDGPFGRISGNYFLGYDFGSWLGTTSTLPEGLSTLVSLPTSGTNQARNTFIYTKTPGLFIFPGNGTLRSVSGYYGNYNPITSNTSAYYNNVYNGNTVQAATVPVGGIMSYPLLGNVLAESFRHLEQNYDSTVTITAQP